jgi:hypothetical protein
MSTPAIQAFLDDLDALVARADWPALDRDAVTRTPGHDAVRVVLPHRTDERRNVELEVHDHHVIVTFHPEHLKFTLQSEALQFVEMLGDGRVTVLVKRRLFWNAIWSYRDGLPLPFNKTLEPWLNLHPRVEQLQFGFDAERSFVRKPGGDAG